MTPTGQPWRLTVDYGPDAKTTPLILDVLARYHAPATFFVISGRIQGNEALMKRIVYEGHEIGNHLTRDEPSIKLPAEVFEAKLLDAHWLPCFPYCCGVASALLC